MQAASSTTPTISDRECLEAWRRERSAEGLRPLVERYGALIYSSAFRRTGSAEQASDVTRAVFLVLARRARKLRKNTVLAGWLFQVTALACRKLRRRNWLRWFRRKPPRVVAPDATLWTRVTPDIDRALDRLRTKQRNAVLLCAFVNYDLPSSAKILRTKEPRAAKRLARGLKKMAKRLSRRSTPVDIDALKVACSSEGCSASPSENLFTQILNSIAESRGQRPSFKLARRTLNALAFARWRRRILIGVPTFNVLLAIVGAIIWQIDGRTGHSRLLSEFVYWVVRFEVRKMAEPARPWPTNVTTPRLDASLVHSANDLYQTTNIWLAHLDFTREQWKALEPKRIGPMPNFVRPDGMWLLRNPKAQRSGLIGVLGYDLDWTHGEFEFGSVAFTNVAVRIKGNAGALVGPKRPFKVDLNRFVKGQKLGGLDELTFNNLLWDHSCVSDALGYEFFRDAGVPAPRTAYAWLTATVAKQWDRKPLGLYLMVEPLGEAFVAERFGSKKTPMFKPVTYEFFKHLGDDWSAYAGIYDLKTKATPEQQRRVIEFAKLISSATDAEFIAQVGDFLDLDEFARFLAGEVLLSNYDSILADGQNFYMYLDTRSNKFGFIPWDLDAAWGHFWLASKQEMEHASIWHPWVGENRFIERVMAVEEFRRIYRAHLEDFLTRLYVPQRLHQRIDELAAVLHGPVASESAFRLNKFEQSVGLKPVVHSPTESERGFNQPAHELKPFIEARAKSVRQQLDGKSKGIILKPPARK